MVKSFNQYISEGAAKAGLYTGELTSAPIQALNRAKDTVAYKILKFIYKAGSTGVRYTDIVKFIIEDIQGREYTNKDRGYYGTNLIGTTSLGYRVNRRDELVDNKGQKGLLIWYGQKLENGRWTLKSEIFDLISKNEFGDIAKSSKSAELLSKIASKR